MYYSFLINHANKKSCWHHCLRWLYKEAASVRSSRMTQSVFLIPHVICIEKGCVIIPTVALRWVSPYPWRGRPWYAVVSVFVSPFFSLHCLCLWAYSVLFSTFTSTFFCPARRPVPRCVPSPLSPSSACIASFWVSKGKHCYQHCGHSLLLSHNLARTDDQVIALVSKS